MDDKLVETKHLASNEEEEEYTKRSESKNTKSRFDFLTKKSPVNKRVNNSSSAINLNSIANITAAEPLTNDLEIKTSTSRQKFSSYGELNNLKSILKKSVNQLSSKKIDNQRASTETKSIHNFKSETSSGGMSAKKFDSETNQDKKNSDELNEILINNHHLYKFYITRLKHSLIISFLILMPIQNILLFFVSLLHEQDKTQLFFESITLCTVSLLALILMVYLAYNEKRLKEYPILICTIIYTLITLNQIIPVMRLKSRDFTTIEYGSFIIFNIVVIHSIFPLNKMLTILYSSSISLFNFILLSFLLFNTNLNFTVIIKKVN